MGSPAMTDAEVLALALGPITTVEQCLAKGEAMDPGRVVGVVRAGRGLAWVSQLTLSSPDFFLISGANSSKTMYANLRELRAMPLDWLAGGLPV